MKEKVVPFLLVLSLAFIIYLLITQYITSTYTPNDEDLDLLAEMIVMVLESEQYAEIANKEQIHAIKPSVSRFNVSNPDLIYLYEIQVMTEKQTYIFTCDDDACSTVSNGGWLYSRYSEEKPILPIQE